MQLIAPSRAPADALVLDNTTNPMTLGDAVQRAGAVVLRFPKWTDGRAYSQAVLLRSRLRYTGEIRATGEVLIDMLPLLRRCGFDTAELADGQDPVAARRALDQFDGHYQADATGAAAAGPRQDA